MRATYDREADAIYIALSDAQPTETVVIDEHRTVDVDAEGKAVGIEIVGVSNYSLDDIAERFNLRDQVAVINHEATAAMHRGIVYVETVVPNAVAGVAPPVGTERTEPVVSVPG
jgi:uncharacterized protein YuzE